MKAVAQLKRPTHRFGTLLLSLMTLCVFLTSSAPDRVVAEEATSSQPVVFATATIAGSDALWSGAEQIAAAMKYREIIQVGRALLKSQLKVDALDPSQPLGIALATDGSTVATFGYVPFKPGEKLELAAIEAIKDSIKNLDKNNLFKGDFYTLGNTLIIGLANQKNLVSAIPAEKYQTLSQTENLTTLMQINVNVEALPNELLEAGASLIRQKLASQLSEESPDEIQNIEQALNKYNELAESVSSLLWSLTVDGDANLSSKVQLSLKPTSKLASSVEKSFNAPTRWNAVYSTPNAIYASAQASDNSDLVVKSDIASTRKALNENMLRSLDVLVDDPNNLEIAKEIVSNLADAIIADAQSGVADSGLALCADPLMLVATSTTSSSAALEKATKILSDRLQKEFPELGDSMTTESIEGYNVLAFELPFRKISSDLPDYLAKKSFAAKIGYSDDAAVFIAGFDEAAIKEEFQRVAIGGKETGAQPHASVVDAAQIAKVVQSILATCEDVRPVAAKSVAILANAQDATIVSKDNFADDMLTFEFTISHGLFAAAGDVIRLNLIKTGNGDEGQDLDDLFDDEE